MKIIKSNLYVDIKSILEQARSTAVRAVNFSMVIAYRQIGKRIVEDQQQGNKKADYGQYLLKDLAKKLTVDFGKGFDERELRKMRQFFLLFPIRDALRPESGKGIVPIIGAISSGIKNKTMPAIRDAVRPELKKNRQIKPEAHTSEIQSSSKINNSSINHALRHELSWTHYRLLISVENEAARKYYMNEAAEQNWSTRILERQINTLYFERLLSSKNKSAITKKSKKEVLEDKPTILHFVKDPYVLELLTLNPNATLYEKN